MLSTDYRLRMEFICKCIIEGAYVELSDMIWAEKLARVNRSAGTMLRQARRRAQNPGMKEGDMDDFLNALDIGGIGDEAKGISGFSSVDDIVEWFKQDKPDDWRQRD